VEFYGLGLDYPWRYPSLVENLTGTDIQKVAEKYLHPDKYLLVVVGNQAQMPQFAQAPGQPGEKEKKDEAKKP
jgi:predicted Zn-dependent peptidase